MRSLVFVRAFMRSWGVKDEDIPRMFVMKDCVFARKAAG